MTAPGSGARRGAGHGAGSSEAEVQWPTDVDALLAFALKAEEEEDYRTHCQAVDRLVSEASPPRLARTLQVEDADGRDLVSAESQGRDW